MLHHAKDLSPEERRTHENLMGRPIREDELVSIKGIEPSAIVPSRLSLTERQSVIEKLREYFIRVDAQRKPVTAAEQDEITNEALRSTRPGYRPIR